MTFENVHNYYEKPVQEEIRRRLTVNHEAFDETTIEDIGCVALNQLPPRYVRHDVDMIFYLTPQERHEMENSVQEAVSQAITLVSQHKRR